MITKKAFTLVETMIVMAIVGVLFMIVSVPYSYYAERARVQDTSRQIEQLWTLAHQSVRNGSVTSGSENANLLLVIDKNAESVDLYAVPLDISAESLKTTTVFPTEKMKLQDSVALDPLKILNIKENNSEVNQAKYFLESPDGTGTFLENPSLSRIIITIGYPNGTIESGRAREIQLFEQ